MKISMKLIESDRQIQQKITKALLSDCKKFMDKIKGTLQQKIPNLIYASIVNTPEYLSIVGGNLRLELGIPDGQIKIEGLINTWISNIVYEYTPPSIVSNKIKSRVKVYGIQSDFADVLNTKDAYVIDKIRGYSLPWLEWLLLDGNKIIVPGHDVVFGPNRASRTGLAVMRISSNGWSISEFNGTQSNNWITRAIDAASPEIYKILEDVLK